MYLHRAFDSCWNDSLAVFHKQFKLQIQASRCGTTYELSYARRVNVTGIDYLDEDNSWSWQMQLSWRIFVWAKLRAATQEDVSCKGQHAANWLSCIMPQMHKSGDATPMFRQGACSETAACRESCQTTLGKVGENLNIPTASQNSPWLWRADQTS